MTKPNIEKFATLDFEASSLSQESWPIEVGLSWLADGEVQTWSTLIRPAPDWNLSDWAPQSAAVHGIALEELDDAPAAYRVVGDLLESLGNRVLVSDAPEFETRWLTRLMKAGAQATVPNVEDYHSVSSASFSGLALDMLYEALERSPAPYRAGPDSARLAHAWRKAMKY
ncbi:3'-5' exonuclease [Sulfitobacter sp.]|uniref:3'-5' exonuclease n=1 Tax=Sulfitobacter sp. TaxID=1903071 RepID=UPI0030022BEE